MNFCALSTLDLRDLVESLSVSLQKLVRHDYAVLYVHDPETNHPIAHAPTDAPFAKNTFEKVRSQIKPSIRSADL